MSIHIPFDNTYARLPERFHARLDPAPVAAPRIIRVNTVLAEQLGIDPDALASPEGAAVLAFAAAAPGSEPLAQAYAGHQFGNFVPQLGDGRACLLGEVIGTDGIRRDIQLKGSGRTRFSRGGDGRAALGPVLREYLISEAMAALGVPTTRTLAAVTTGEAVRRERFLPGAVLTRVASSHLRVGTFQYFAAREDADGVRMLADYAIARHYPAAASAVNPYLAFFEAVVAAQADLMARWLLVGFIHGVMNTDNCSIAGETIDYGPCAFMDAYDPATVFSSIDHAGRYAYGRQPRIAQWNLARLAETLLPLFADNEAAALSAAHEALNGFAPTFDAAYMSGLCRKLGLPGTGAADEALARDFLQYLTVAKADFTLSFRALADAADGEGAKIRAMFADAAGFDAWFAGWQARLAEAQTAPADTAASMRAVNPIFIPRNHLVEAALNAATDNGDFAPFEALLAVLARPFRDDPDLVQFTLPAQPEEQVRQTFCGT